MRRGKPEESENINSLKKRKNGSLSSFNNETFPRKYVTQSTLKNLKVDTEFTKSEGEIKFRFTKAHMDLYQGQTQNFTIYYNIIEILYVLVCPSCSWRKLKKKNILFQKGIKRLFFQLDVLNYIKHMQQLEILNYSILEPYENVIVQFLSKPSISLAQRKDAYDQIRTINDINTQEANEVFFAITQLLCNKEKSNFQKRLQKLTKYEVRALFRKMKDK